MPRLTVAKLLRNAATRIETTGWCQKRYSIGEMNCLITALQIEAEGHPKIYTRAMKALLKHLNVNDIVRWNDDPNRTQTEVAWVLRDVAYQQ